MTSKQKLRSFILVPIDFLYTTSYRLSIVTFALGCTVWPQYIPGEDLEWTDELTLKLFLNCYKLLVRNFS